MKRFLRMSLAVMLLAVLVAAIATPAMSADKSFKWRMATLYPRGTAFGEV
jgi:hypothetical protein